MPVPASISWAGDAQPAAGLAQAAFEDVAHAQFAAGLLHVDRAALVGEGRVAGDDEQPFDPRQAGDDVLDDAVDEIFLLGVAAHVLKRQHGDRRPLRDGESGAGAGFRRRDCARRHVRFDAVDAHRPGDVLDALLAEVLEAEIELVAHLVAHDAADADAAGLGERFEAGSDVDAVAENVVAVDDDVAEIDADAKLDAPVGGHVGVALAPCRAARRRRSAPRRQRWETRSASRRRWS